MPALHECRVLKLFTIRLKKRKDLRRKDLRRCNFIVITAYVKISADSAQGFKLNQNNNNNKIFISTKKKT